MSITFTKGDIFLSRAEMLVNPVNCMGVMGRGLALQFKQRFPETFINYHSAVNAFQIDIGKCFVDELYTPIDPWAPSTQPHYITHFPTKYNWREPSRIEYIHKGLNSLHRILKAIKPASIAIPPLGCGLGGLQWAIVKPCVTKLASYHPTTLFVVYEPT